MRRCAWLWIVLMLLGATRGVCCPLPEVFLTADVTSVGMLDFYDAIVWSPPEAGAQIHLRSKSAPEAALFCALVCRRGATLGEEARPDMLQIDFRIHGEIASESRADLYMRLLRLDADMPVRALLLASEEACALEAACEDLARLFADASQPPEDLKAFDNLLVGAALSAAREGRYQLTDIDPKA